MSWKLIGKISKLKKGRLMACFTYSEKVAQRLDVLQKRRFVHKHFISLVNVRLTHFLTVLFFIVIEICFFYFVKQNLHFCVFPSFNFCRCSCRMNEWIQFKNLCAPRLKFIYCDLIKFTLRGVNEFWPYRGLNGGYLNSVSSATHWRKLSKIHE